jgi:hypothetical protein
MAGGCIEAAAQTDRAQGIRRLKLEPVTSPRRWETGFADRHGRH